MALRIAHVVSSRGALGGAERVLVAVVREAERRRWQQIVVNPFATHDRDTPLAHAVAPVEFVGIPCGSLFGLPPLRRTLARRLHAWAPDVVHVHLFHALAAVASIRRNGEVRVLSHQHGQLLHTQRRRSEAVFDRWAGRRFDRIAACSDDVRRFLTTTYRYPPERVVTIRNGWEGVPPPRCGLAEAPTAVCVANLRPEKGHDILLRAWSRVVRAVPDARLLLLGEGPVRHQLEDLRRQLGLDDRVQLVGAVNDVWPYLAQAHVFVLPSRHEPFGIVAIEAMAAGLPVVASAVGGLRELVEPGVTGELVAVGDEEDLAAAVTGLLASSERRSALGEAGKARAGEYTMERTVAGYLSLYEEMTGRVR